MKKLRIRRQVLAIAGLAWLVGASAGMAQVEQAHLRVDGMT